MFCQRLGCRPRQETTVICHRCRESCAVYLQHPQKVDATVFFFLFCLAAGVTHDQIALNLGCVLLLLLLLCVVNSITETI